MAADTTNARNRQQNRASCVGGSSGARPAARAGRTRVLVSFTLAAPLRVIGVTLMLLVFPTVTFAQTAIAARLVSGL
jgi:hypothetical protein